MRSVRRSALLVASMASAVLVASGVVLVGVLLAAPASALSRDNGASFAVKCAYSHRNSDDPIVHPGKQGAAHSHDYFGNRSVRFDSTYGSMLAARTTCTRPQDRAGYWFPTVKWSGKKLRAYRAVFYYRAGGKDHTQVEPFAADLRVINGTRISWRCGVKDTGAASPTPPKRCRNGVLGLRIVFPDCSNGQLDSADHRSHVVRSTPQSGGGRACPSTHPIPVPTLTINANFKIPTTSGRVSLSSGAASTMHADFWNTWEQAELERLVERCINEVPPSEPRPAECRAPKAA